ncbi:phage terminase small subunit-related protein [Candidatus Eisenbacteria bacterium]|uniref:Phage terminase small subunit-related protein n=1 Tax=Eiseniibacteriota bacterium TaxID=2212470 RepID=A0ABV6YLJ8_UNCEI
MGKSHTKIREEARRLYLTGEMQNNAEIAKRLGVKAHTVGKWRRDEGWDDLRLKIDVRAAEAFVEKIATDRVSLNVRHYRLWDLLLARLADDLKTRTVSDIRELERIAAILERSQKGQRLAKGLSTTGETEEVIRAQSQVEIRRIIDVFIDAVKRQVPDEEIRDSIRRHILDAIPAEDATGTGGTGDAVGI